MFVKLMKNERAWNGKLSKANGRLRPYSYHMHIRFVNSIMRRRAIASKIASRSLNHSPWKHKHMKMKEKMN